MKKMVPGTPTNFPSQMVPGSPFDFPSSMSPGNPVNYEYPPNKTKVAVRDGNPNGSGGIGLVGPQPPDQSGPTPGKNVGPMKFITPGSETNSSNSSYNVSGSNAVFIGANGDMQKL